MKSVLISTFLLFVGFFAFGQSALPAKMDYHFSWDGRSSLLMVDVYYNPGKTDTTSFIYGWPEAGNEVDIFRVVKNIQAGKSDSISIDSNSRKILVWHKTGGLKKLHYEINGALISAAKHNNANEQFRPQLVPGSFYSLSFNLFMKVDTAIFKDFYYKWDRWPPGIGYFSSADPQSNPGAKVRVTPGQLMKIYMAMDNQLAVNRYDINNVPYYAITTRRDTLNDMQADLKPFFSTFFPAITAFWNDYRDKDYFVSVLPFLHDVPDNYTGYGLLDGFSMRYRGKYDIEKMEVIAHETSHKWIGNKVEIKQKGFEYMWFEEGFNDYVAICLLANTGMLSGSGFIAYINDKNLAPHYKSPVATAPADSIEKYFWVNHDYEKLPYQRGFIYAFYFDNQIRLASGGKKTIRDFLLALLAKKVAIKERDLTIDDYIETAALFLPKEQIADEVNKYLQQGALLDFHSIKLIQGFEMNYKDTIPVLSLSPGADLSGMMGWK
jgi:hypothetical protein